MIIGLCGQAGAGKSTVANYLCDSFSFQRRRFADPLKNMMRALGLSEEEIEGPFKEQPCLLLGGQTPRRAMQTLGTEWGREQMGKDFWVRCWKAGLPIGRVVAEDVRFENEFAAIREVGGVIVRVDRPGLPERMGHSSEHGLEGLEPDHVLHNTGGLLDLRRSTRNLLFKLQEKAVFNQQYVEVMTPLIFEAVREGDDTVNADIDPLGR